MKRQILFIALLVQASWVFSQWRDLSPVVKKAPVQVLSGNRLKYHSTKKGRISFPVKSFDSVVLYTRERIDGKATPYAIHYRLKSGDNRYGVKRVKKDRHAFYADKSIGFYPSKSHRKTLHLQPEDELLELEVTGSNPVDMRLVGYKDGKKTPVSPLHSGKRITIISGRKNSYYKLNSKIPAKIHVNGSGKLIVYTRLRMRDRKPVSYGFSYKTSDGRVKYINVSKAVPSRKSIYTSRKIKEKPSVYHKTVIDLDAVPVDISFHSKNPVDARFVWKSGKKNIWKPIAVKDQPVKLKVRGKNTIRNYHRLKPGQPMSFTVPAKHKGEIRILVRGEFTYDMFSDNDYIIQLTEKGKVIKTYKLTCSKSGKLIYVDDPSRVPGTLNKIYFKVPHGTHRYELRMNSTDKTALIRIENKI